MNIAVPNPLILFSNFNATKKAIPEKIIDKIVDGKIDKFYAETVLMEQAFVKDNDKTIEELVNETIASLGENMKIRRFSRFRLGEE